MQARMFWASLAAILFLTLAGCSESDQAFDKCEKAVYERARQPEKMSGWKYDTSEIDGGFRFTGEVSVADGGRKISHRFTCEVRGDDVSLVLVTKTR